MKHIQLVAHLSFLNHEYTFQNLYVSEFISIYVSCNLYPLKSVTMQPSPKIWVLMANLYSISN